MSIDGQHAVCNYYCHDNYCILRMAIVSHINLTYKALSCIIHQAKLESVLFLVSGKEGERQEEKKKRGRVGVGSGGGGGKGGRAEMREGERGREGGREGKGGRERGEGREGERGREGGRERGKGGRERGGGRRIGREGTSHSQSTPQDTACSQLETAFKVVQT